MYFNMACLPNINIHINRAGAGVYPSVWVHEFGLAEGANPRRVGG
jgi:hypothetical protein